jgi:hypothetical protein
MRILVTLAILLTFTLPLARAQQPSSKTHEAAPPQVEQTGISAGDTQALRMDLQRMKALVQQMQTNLAFVTNTQDPLKHQFELEIEMWQLQIARMERQLNGSAERNESGRISK